MRIAVFLPPAMLVAAALGGSAAAGFAQERGLALDDLSRATVISEARISPSGRSVAYVLLQPAESPVGWEASIRIAAAEDGESRRVGEGARLRWSPDGRWLAFASRAEAGRQIWRAPAAGGEVERLTNAAGGVADYEWSPDGRALAYLARPSGEEPEPGFARRWGEPGVGHQLFLLEIETGETRQLTRASGTVHSNFFGGESSFSWSPNGAEIVFAVQPTTAFEDSYRSDLYALDVADGRVRPLVERPGMDFRPRWSPDGDRVAFTSSYGARDRLGSHGIALVSAGGGMVRDVGEPFGESFLNAPNAVIWSTTGEEVYYVAPRGATRQLVSLDVEDGAVSAITDGAAVHTGFSFSRDRRTMAFLASDPDWPYEVYVSPMAEFVPRRITFTNEHLADVRMPETERVRWRNGQGHGLEGVLIMPPAGASEPPYPLATWLHGGPDGHAVLAFDPTVPFPLAGFDPHPLRLLAARGYAVFMPNFRGSVGYGRDLLRGAVGQLGPAAAEDVLSGVDSLVARGIADPDRLAVLGWASGAYKAAHLVTASARFAAAVLGAGHTELWAAYAEGDFTVQWESVMGGTPWEYAARYDRDSPLRHADNAVTPTLLLHGDRDSLVPSTQSVQFHVALKQRGVPTELWLYRGQGHGILHPEARADAAERIIDWLDRWLEADGGGTPDAPDEDE